MDHDRTVFLAIFADVSHVEAFRHEHIELDGTALPGTADGVFQVEVQFRAVECAVAFVDDVRDVAFFDDIMQGLGSQFPDFVGAHGVFRTSGQFDVVFQAELFVCLIEEVHDAGDFFFHLARQHEDMGVVLSEAADAEQAVEGTVEFVTMDQAEFSHAHGEITIAVDIALIDQDAAGAVHRFDGIGLFIDGGEIHVIAVVIPVAGLFPEVTVEDQRCHDFIVIGFVMEFMPELEQVVAQDHSLGMEEREARAFFVEAEQVELFAQFAMVAFFSFFHHLQVFIEFRFLFKSGTVNTLEHLVVFITAPVSAGNGTQFEGLDGACRSAVRTGTEVDEVALAVEGDDSIFRKVFNEFYFIILTGVFEELQSIGAGQDFFSDREVFFDDLGHFSFDSGEVFLCETVFCIEVVVETVFNGRANSKFNTREEVLDSLSHDMRCCMAEGIFPFLVGEGEKFNGRTVDDSFTEVRDFTIDFCY